MRLVAAATTGNAQCTAASALLNVAQVVSRWALRVVGLHRGVCETPALVALDGGAADARRREGANHQATRAHRHLCRFSTAGLALLFGLGVAPSVAAQQNPTRREPVAQGATAESERFHIRAGGEIAGYTDTNGVSVLSPSAAAKVTTADGNWSARGSYLMDIVSAASVDIVSSASSRWTEVRQEGVLGVDRQLSSRARLSVDTAVSYEPDYLSIGGGALLRLEPGNRQLNPTFGYSFTHDTAGRTGTPFSVYSKSLAIHTLNLGLETIVDRSTVAFFELDGTLELGDSAKPYRFLPLFAPEVAPLVQPGASLETVNQLRLPGRIAERVPNERLRVAAFARFSRRFRESSLIASERLYVDDWGLEASTTDVRYLFVLSPRISALLDARWHIQNEVSFWNRAYTSTLTAGGVSVPYYRSGDRELSSLWVATLGAGLRYGLGPAAEANRAAISVQFDESATRFLDTLYIAGRWAHLLVVQIESEF